MDSVLSGTLSRKAGRLLITAELVDVASGARIWSNRYDPGAADLLSVQDEIARAIMDDGLRLRLSSDERQRVRNPTNDGEAFDRYLQARHLQRRATEDDYLIARELLRRAIVRDPKFALAHVAMGATYAMMAADGLERPTDAWPEANRYTRKALELDPAVTEAHVIAHAKAFFFDWDWEGAELERERLLRSLPGDFDPQFLRAFALERWALGQPDEALQAGPEDAGAGSPQPQSQHARSGLPGARRAARCGRQPLREVDSQRSGGPEPAVRPGRGPVQAGAFRRGHRAPVARPMPSPATTRSRKCSSSARGDNGYRQIEKTWVRVQLNALEARKTTSYVSPLDFARVHAQLGDAEQAFRYLDAAFDDRSPGLVFLNVDRAWDNVRKDPRFVAAVARVGLP